MSVLYDCLFQLDTEFFFRFSWEKHFHLIRGIFDQMVKNTTSAVLTLETRSLKF